MINLITKRPTGYITYLSLLSFALAFVMSFYYYDSINEISPWYKDGLYIAVFVVFLGILVNFVGYRFYDKVNGKKGKQEFWSVHPPVGKYAS